LVLVIVSAAGGGIAFACLGQPVCHSITSSCQKEIELRSTTLYAGTFFLYGVLLSHKTCCFWTTQVITGYLLAGSAVGPGGFSFVSELVQVIFHLGRWI
jgi:hypothetical protein